MYSAKGDDDAKSVRVFKIFLGASWRRITTVVTWTNIYVNLSPDFAEILDFVRLALGAFNSVAKRSMQITIV